jgi:hypothetical protein
VVKTPPIRQEPAPQRPSTAAAPALTPKKTFYAHKVKWCGETLSIIAAWYTGDWKNWKSIAEANPQIKPNLIYEGIEIQIPGSLLKTQDGMPKEFVEKFYANAKREKSQPKSQSTWTQEEDVKLFGPKKSSK